MHMINADMPDFFQFAGVMDLVCDNMIGNPPDFEDSCHNHAFFFAANWSLSIV